MTFYFNSKTAPSLEIVKYKLLYNLQSLSILLKFRKNGKNKTLYITLYFFTNIISKIVAEQKNNLKFFNLFKLKRE